MNRRIQSFCGFTLVEVLIGTTLAGAMLAAVLSSYVFLGRNLMRLANYHTLAAKSQDALARLQSDFSLAYAVKPGTTPTATTVTLVLAAGDVTYTYDSATGSLRRQATFGASPDLQLLKNEYASCTAFAFDYATTAFGPATSQFGSGVNAPYSIKQIGARFTLKTPGTQDAATRTMLEVVAPQILLRNRQAASGD
ncbi:MAG: hypothetical protein JWQ62_914 [Lacunisphaera sp.]|nr:hypothetical protein [Lacunisphaera sp.]